jgi:hypothetical protein
MPKRREDAMHIRRVFNGVDGITGRYLPAAETEEEFALRIRDEPLGPAQLREARWWIDSFGIDDPNRAPAQHVDPKNLASAGWGVIFASGVTSDEVEEALRPLLEHRRKSAGAYFKVYHLGPDEPTKEAFLADNHAGIGPADPRKVPYYLLIVGSPQQIPFRFQYLLDVQYAVASYAAYAQNVVETEKAAEEGSDALPLKQVTFFGVSREGDQATERSMAELIQPLVGQLSSDCPGWPLQLLLGPQATKERLSRLLGGGETPAVLLTASHGMSFPFNDGRQRSCQGALLCQDWPGENAAVLPEHYFSGMDLAQGANLRGLIAFHFACYSGGTPDVSSFADSALSKPKLVAPAPFVSGLAQHLLGHPRGALAVVGHVDRAWSTAFSWSEPGQVQIFENTLKRLLDGHPIGSAMEFFNQRHAELAVEYSELCQDRDRPVYVDPVRFARVYRANNDVRNFVVLGDPAVKMAFRAQA